LSRTTGISLGIATGVEEPSFVGDGDVGFKGVLDGGSPSVPVDKEGTPDDEEETDD
jgi:hypothetical protein